MSARSLPRPLLTTSAAVGPDWRHAHVERAVALEREAALGLVELHRGDADVEHDAVDRREALRRRRCRSRSPKRPSTSVRRPPDVADERAAGGDGARDRDRWRGRARRRSVQDGAGVAAGAEGAVNVGAAALRRERVAALPEAARERGARSLCGHPRPTGAAPRRHSRAPPSPPPPPMERRPAPNSLRCPVDFFAGARAPLFEALGLPHLEFLPKADKSDLGR